MKFTTLALTNVEELKLVTASSSYGIGFINWFLMAIAQLTGKECPAYSEQIDKAKNSAAAKMADKAAAVGATGVMNIQFQVYGSTVFISGIAYR